MNQTVQDAAGFIDATLQNEGAWYRAEEVESRLGGALGSYGASVGAVRGTIRDAGRKFKGLGHDDVTALASRLWGQPGPAAGPFMSAGSPPWSCCSPGRHCCATPT